MRVSIIAVLILGIGASSAARLPKPQTETRPPANVFIPNTTQDAGAYQPPPKPADGVPKGAWVVSWDRKSWITSIDGKRSGIVYSLGSEHVIRGGNLGGFVVGRIASTRLPRGKGKYEAVGSMLTLVRESPTELVVRVTRIAGGPLPWSESNDKQFPPRLKIRIAGGGRDLEVVHDRGSRYRCSVGEPNCAP